MPFRKSIDRRLSTREQARAYFNFRRFHGLVQTKSSTTPARVPPAPYRIMETSSQNAGPMAQGPSRTSAASPSSLSHDWAGDQNGTSLSYTSSTQPLTQARTEYSNNSTDRTSSSLTRSRSIIGLHPDAPIDEEHDHGPASELLWSKIRAVLREPFAEFWGVVIMVMFGDGSVAQVLLSTGQATAPGGNGYGSYQSINWGYVHSRLCMNTH